MAKYRTGSHTKTRLTVHLVWITKYRYSVLQGDIQERCRRLIIQDCDSLDIVILEGVVSKNHIHLHIEYPPKLSISSIAKQLKGRSSRLLQKEYPSLKKKYWGQHFWARGYGAFSTGNITDKMVKDYIDNHKDESNETRENFFLEE